MAGAAGFDDGPEHHLNPGMALGSVFGIRQWQRNADASLQGAHGTSWADGENLATCQKGHRVPWSLTAKRKKELGEELKALQAASPGSLGVMNTPGPAGDEETRTRIRELERVIGTEQDCGCGFWAYWSLDPHEFSMGEKPVAGVIEGYGKVIIGKRGFRCEKARIVALHCAYEYVRPLPPKAKGSEIQEPGWHQVFTSDYERGTAQAIARLAADEAELAGRYPSARIYATMDAMLASWPLTKDYR